MIKKPAHFCKCGYEFGKVYNPGQFCLECQKYRQRKWWVFECDDDLIFHGRAYELGISLSVEEQTWQKNVRYAGKA